MYTGQRAHLERAAQRFVKALENSYYEPAVPLTLEYRITSPPTTFDERPRDGYQPLKPGQQWGTSWQVGWFHATGRVPDDWAGQTVVARLDIDGEICLFDPQGCPIDGLTSTSVYMPNWLHDRHLLFEPARGGEPVDLWFQASASKMTGLELDRDPARDDPDRFGTHTARLQRACLCVFDVERWRLFLDANTLLLQMEALPDTSVRRKRLIHTLSRAANAAAGGLTPQAIAQARAILKPLLDSPAAESDLTTIATGHAHLDTAWLWPLDEGIRKCARTFSRQAQLLDRYPDYVFGASQAQHYAFVKKHYPALYEKVKAHVKAGRWEVQGIMWVESDTNLISGESMVRQCLLGHRFFRDEFGVEPRNLWLPDVFGYSAALPGVLRDAGVTAMITQKLSWNVYNRPPHHTFRWAGIDGNHVVVHFPPEDTYNSVLNPARLMFARDNFEESDRCDRFLTLFGLGDGGGGPNDDILEIGQRQNHLEGVPRVTFAPAQDFFDHLVDHEERFDAWAGELYFERHQGVLTTQAKVKRCNRQIESALVALESLAATLPPERYPAAELDRIWKQVLLHQFHDILPGSSIHKVYQQAHETYASLAQQTQALLTDAAGHATTPDDGGAVTLINTLSTGYRGALELPATPHAHWVDEQGRAVPTQATEQGTCLVSLDVPGLGRRTIRPGSGGDDDGSSLQRDRERVLENDHARYTFDEHGQLAGLFDKKLGLDLMTPAMRGNRLVMHSDQCVFENDAWDVEIEYENQPQHVATLDGEIERIVGPARQTLVMSLSLPDARITQRVHLGTHSARLDFETLVDWNPRHKMLRVYFDVDIHSDTASYEVQFGHVRRPTHRNTAWDYARYEVCGHGYADLSQPDRGVALLNDCKYGYKVHGQTMSLTLLRSPTFPDAEADLGQHEMTYSLLPHAGPLAGSSVLAEAHALNRQPLVVPGGVGDGDALRFPVAPPDADHVVVSAIKRAEDDPETVVVRLYEAMGMHARTRVAIDPRYTAARASDVLERPGEPIALAGGAVVLDFKPFEIKTLLLS